MWRELVFNIFNLNTMNLHTLSFQECNYTVMLILHLSGLRAVYEEKVRISEKINLESVVI